MKARFRAVLFDLDGTLVDTAPDLAAALNAQRARRGLDALPLETVRPYASHGTPGLLSVGFGLRRGDPTFPTMRLEYLNLYEDTAYRESRLFDGMGAVLDELEARGLKWGVVTNKPARFTNAILASLDLAKRASVAVSGDSAPRPKPAPDPMFLAADRVALPPAECLYVGDAARDVEAARAAGMPVVIALWGYLGEDDRPGEWGAAATVESPTDLLRLL